MAHPSRLAIHGGGASHCVFAFFCVFFLFSSALLLQPAFADVNQDLLDQINKYRIDGNLSALAENRGAACVAQGLANYYKGRACSNSTGADQLDGSQPENLPAVLPACNLQADNVANGYIAPDCVPAGTSAANAVLVAFQNYTDSYVYSDQLNSSQFTSAGVGSVDDQWFVLILATSDSSGNYLSQNLDPTGAAHSFIRSPYSLILSLSLAAATSLALQLCFSFPAASQLLLSSS